MLAFLLGGAEMVLTLAVILILIGAKWLPGISKGLGDGLFHFRNESDRLAEDAGESLGGIYGKPAAEALTPENQTAELYAPADLRDASGSEPGRDKGRFRAWKRFWRLVWRYLFKRSKAKM